MPDFACEVSQNEKEDIWRIFRDITPVYNSTNQHVGSHPSYPNLYLSGTRLGQTSYGSESPYGKRYFTWVTVNQFKLLLTNILIEKRGVKL